LVPEELKSCENPKSSRRPSVLLSGVPKSRTSLTSKPTSCVITIGPVAIAAIAAIQHDYLAAE